MDEAELSEVVHQLSDLLESRYLFPDIALTLSGVLASGLADGRYPADPAALAAAVTADLQSINDDKHLRLVYHEEAIPQRAPGDDAEEYAAMARWAARTCGGVACAQRLAGNVGYLDLQPVLFPSVMSGEAIAAAMTLLSGTAALIIDLRRCLGGEPSTISLIVSYLWTHEPVQLTGLRERAGTTPHQAWTQPYVPGRRFGREKPLYVLTSATTFSGGEQLSYDLQQLGRATVVGEPTRGGAHAREGFTVHPHLEATISVAESVSPRTGGNWEGAGVTPDIHAAAPAARDTAYRLALGAVIAAGGPVAAEAADALAADGPLCPA